MHMLPSPPHGVVVVQLLPRLAGLAKGCACGSWSMPLTPRNEVLLGAALSVRRTSSQVAALTALRALRPTSGHRMASMASAPWLVHVYEVEVTMSMLTSSPLGPRFAGFLRKPSVNVA